MKRGKLAFVFGGTWVEHLPMGRELIGALRTDGWIVDVYNVPIHDPAVPQSAFAMKAAYPAGKLWPWEQGFKWILTRPYDGFIGSCGAGIWCASVWARLHRKPLAMLSDELTITAGEYWRRKEMRANQMCQFTIIPDLCRWELLQRLNELSASAEVYELPNAPVRGGSRLGIAARRKAWGVRDNDVCLLALGGFSERYGIERFTKAIPRIPDDVHLVVHERIRLGSAFRAMADLVSERYPNVHFSTDPVPYEQVGDLAAAADIGIALYSDLDLNFALMGKASGKICYYLANGIPVIHEQFDNLRFIAEAGAGEAAHLPEEILDALEKIRSDLPGYKRRAASLYEAAVKPDRYLEAICKRVALWGRAQIASR